tara:strand:+ start:3947 stop:4561 length:615 start_codon:yes stop_codon:yes gene_type:complete
VKTTWGDVEKGDVVELGGREWRVEKIKRKKKSAKVEVSHKGRSASSEVKLKDRVTIAHRAADAPADDLHGVAGEQRRWAKRRERDAVLGEGGGIPHGDSSQAEAPSVAEGKRWDKPHGDAEKMLDKLMGATLVGESTDEAAGYYVPHVDVSTVAAHLALFHGGIPEAAEDEGKMLSVHARQHEAASRGEGVLAVQHWHSERRPS